MKRNPSSSANLTVLVAGLVVSLFPAAAQAGNLYRVVNVAASDVLNLRAGPGVQYEIKKTIPPHGMGVQTLGPRRRVGQNEWVEVFYAGHRGWVSTRYLALQLKNARRTTYRTNSAFVTPLQKSPGDGGMFLHPPLEVNTSGIEITEEGAFINGKYWYPVVVGGRSGWIDSRFLEGDVYSKDSDYDSICDGDEINILKTDPRNWDTDGDLLPDGLELRGAKKGLHPLKPNNVNEDTDQDGLSNLDELRYGADPLNADTDGDGVPDGVEVSHFADPSSASDRGAAPPAGELVEVELTIGDHSESKSERYDLIVGPITHQADQFGEMATRTYKLRRGRRYDIHIQHRGSNRGTPDYDYTAEIRFVDPADERLFRIDDPHGILGKHDESGTFYAKGKFASIQPAAQLSRAEWQAEVMRKIGVSDQQFRNYRDFTLPNQDILRRIYGYYEQVFRHNPARLKWAGMAKMAGGAVWGGLGAAVKGRVLVPGIGADRTSKVLEEQLVQMNRDIFLDMAWQHEAYIHGGMEEMKRLARLGELDPQTLHAWKLIHLGDAGSVAEGNKILLRREQEMILADGYRRLQGLGIPGPMAYLTRSPVPGGVDFLEHNRLGYLERFADRWNWIEQDMYPKWVGLPVSRQLELVSRSIERLANREFGSD